MHREDHFGIGHSFYQTAERTVDVVHRRAKIFTAVRRDEDHTLVLFDGFDLCVFEMVIFLHRRKQGIDDGIADDVDVFIVFALAQEIASGGFRRSEIHIREDAGQLAVRFFREGREQISCAEAGFDMTDLDLLVESSQRSGECSRGVSVNEYIVRLLLLQHIFQPAEHAGGDVVEGLPALHDVEVVVHRKMEEIDHLIEHLAVLRGEADFRINVWTPQKLFHDGRHLDGFRPCPENRHYFDHDSCIPLLNG